MRFSAYLILIILKLIISTDLPSQRIIDKEIYFKFNHIYQIKFSFNDSILVLNYRDKIKICDSDNQQIIHEIQVHSHTIDVAKKNYYLAHGDEEGNLSILTLNNNQNLSTIPAHNSKITCIRFSNDDKYIATTGLDNIIKVWSVEEGNLISELNGHDDLITDFQFTLDDNLLISCSADQSVKIWDYTSSRIIKSFNNNSRWLRKIAISPDGVRFATAADDRNIHIYSLVDFSVYKLNKVHVNLISDIKFFDENYLISIGHDQKISLSSIHIPEDEEILSFFKGNPSYRHYFKGVARDKYFTSLEVNHTTRKIYLSTLGRGIISTSFFHNLIEKPHDIFINTVDDFAIDSSTQRSHIGVRKNPFIMAGTITRPKFIKNSYLLYVEENRKSSLSATKKLGKFSIQGLINENQNEYKIITIDKDPHMGLSEYPFKIYRHKKAHFTENLLPELLPIQQKK